MSRRGRGRVTVKPQTLLCPLPVTLFWNLRLGKEDTKGRALMLTLPEESHRKTRTIRKAPQHRKLKLCQTHLLKIGGPESYLHAILPSSRLYKKSKAHTI